MNKYKDIDTGKVYTENELYAEWAEQADDEADIETSFEDWLFLNQWQNGGTLEQIPTTAKKVAQLAMIALAMAATLALMFGTFFLAVVQTSERLYPEPATTTCTVIGYGSNEIIDDYAIAVDSYGHEHHLTISDAVIGDQYTIRHGTVIEKTYEGCQDDNNDYYIIEFENGDLHEVEADDLWTGDEVTVYFYRDEPIRTMYGWR